jgi:protein tyrosine phosphatase (PTP) superfamily phosphohydrolase (DUF442 family)
VSDPDDIRAWQRLSERITTSGRLQEHDPARLAAIGVRRVINLAMPDHPEALPDAAQRFAAEGIEYMPIPVPFDAPEEAHYQAFSAALAGDEPVHVHCIMNWRVSAFFYRWHRDACGMPEPKARALMERQWSPEANDHADAPKWAELIRKRES